jgi:hypothetical protein
MKTQQPAQQHQGVRRERRERLFGPVGDRQADRGFRGGNAGGQQRRLSDRPLKQRPPRQDRQQQFAQPQKQAAPVVQTISPIRGGKKLKVRNFDDSKVSNDDLKVTNLCLIAQIRLCSRRSAS